MKRNKTKKTIRRLAYLLGSGVLALNAIAFMQAYSFTHFRKTDALVVKAKPEKMSLLAKIKTIFLGISVYQYPNLAKPPVNFQTILLENSQGNLLEAWHLKKSKPKGCFLTFHGYNGRKSNVLPEALAFYEMGYDVLMVDLSAHGGSEGHRCTLGFHEAHEVKLFFDWAEHYYERGFPIHIFAPSMGAAAVMRATSERMIQPRTLILECPFARLEDALQNRFALMGLPPFPFVQLLLFWGGVQNNFKGFAHQPAAYAKEIEVPLLLFYGAKDQRVRADEIQLIFENWKGNKKRQYTFAEAAHESYLLKNPEKWLSEVSDFLP
ncbi:MAG: alpha/beta hydrolase [Bernardetiaceae bacterium]|nr:alpha/beta hydrolase [Bernardetiaceae bacterium]